MSRLFYALTMFALLSGGLMTQGLAQAEESPSAIVKKFYQQLHARKYLEGFRLSVYSAAVETLSADEIRELEPDFMRIAEALPAQIETSGEQISGETATVFVKLPGVQKPQEIILSRIEGRWRIGDQETFQYVKKQGRAFFFNIRIEVGERETAEWLEEIYGAQTIYFKAKSRYTTLEELVSLGGVSRQLASGAESGYRFALKLAADGQSFTVMTTPTQYGRTGRRSFFMDQTGVLRAEDKQGQPATAASPKFSLNQ